MKQELKEYETRHHWVGKVIHWELCKRSKFVHNIVMINYKSKVKLATVVEDDQNAPFSIATTLRWRGGRYSFPWIAPLYPWYVSCIAECQARRYQVPFLKSLVWRDLGLNLGLPDHWWTVYPLGQWAGKSKKLRPSSRIANSSHANTEIKQLMS